MKTATSPPPKDQHKHQEHKNNFRKASATGRVRKRSTLEKSTTKPSSQSPLTIDVGNKYSPAAEDVMGTRTTNRWKPSCPPNVQIFARSLTIRKSITFAFFMIFVSCATTWYITWSGTDLGALDFDFSLSHDLSLVEKANSPNPTSKRRDQGLIIIVGSPGVGFASLEKDLTIWSKQYSIRPYSYALPNISPQKYNITEGFLPLIDALTTKVTSAPRGFPTYNRTKSNSSAFFIEEFRQGFNSQWLQNKNIIVGSDSFHHILDNNELKIDKFISEFVGLLPWNDERYSLSGSNDRSTAFVLYRSSRIDHVQSAWSVSSPKRSFVEWITSRDCFNQLDQFSIAEKLYQKGIDVDIIDVNHVVELDLSLSHYIACHILNLACSDDGHLLEAKGNATVNTMASPFNGEVNVGRDTLRELDTILDEYDCCFEFIKNARFFPATSSLYEKFSNCKCSSLDVPDDPRKVTRDRIGELFKQS